MNNNIRDLADPYHLRYLKLDLNSPRLAQAMRNLGLVKEDLNTRKTRDDFISADDRLTDLKFEVY